MRQLMGGAFVAAALACALAACGGSSKTAAPPKTTPSAPPAAAPSNPQPAAAAAPASAPAAASPAAPASAPAAADAGGRGGRGGPPLPPPPKPPSTMPKPATPIVAAAAPSPDPRVGLKPGLWDAGQAAWNMRVVSSTPPNAQSVRLAFDSDDMTSTFLKIETSFCDAGQL